ncbi:hypothetical protein [Paenibacillus sp.]|jgi:hypothetical protein|uniref:hypothetical protein n=1 Tax=Paenibacillus sp. TaxID=58172 RepID=UPI00282B1DD6|nr:hypothetical protein [Paenibacillus sp.]MDR0267859.1 hypothetical protein [Paenibacillus sp.]
MKITQWLLKTVLTVVLISGLTILMTGAIVNSYVQSLLASFNITLEGQSSGLGSMMKGIFGMNHGAREDKVSGSKEPAKLAKPDDGKKASESGGHESINGSASDSSGSKGGESTDSNASTKDNTGTIGNTNMNENNSSNGNANTGGGTVDGEAPDHSIPIMGQGMVEDPSAGKEQAQDGEAAAKPDDGMQKKKEITSSEREQIFGILMTKLPPSEMQKIADAMGHELTDEELKSIEASISRYLSTEEYNALKRILEQ